MPPRPLSLPETSSQSFRPHLAMAQHRRNFSLSIATADKSDLDLLAQPVETPPLPPAEQKAVEKLMSQFIAMTTANVAAPANTKPVPRGKDEPVTDKDLNGFYTEALISKYWPLNVKKAERIIQEVQTLLQDKPRGFEKRVDEKAFEFYDYVPADSSWPEKARELMANGGSEDELKRLAANWSFEKKSRGGLAALLPFNHESFRDWLSRIHTNYDAGASNSIVAAASNVPSWLGEQEGNLVAAIVSLFMPMMAANIKVASDVIQEMTRTGPVARKHPDIGKVPFYQKVHEDLESSKAAVIEKSGKLHEAIGKFQESAKNVPVDHKDYKRSLEAIGKADQDHAEALSQRDEATEQYRLKAHGVNHAASGGVYTTSSNLLGAVMTMGVAAGTAANPALGPKLGAANIAAQVALRLGAGALDDRRRFAFDIKAWLVLCDKLLDENGNVVGDKLRSMFNFPFFMRLAGIQQALGYDQFKILEQVDAISTKYGDGDQVSEEDQQELQKLARQFAQRQAEIRLLGESIDDPAKIKELPKDGKAAYLLKHPLTGIKETVFSQWKIPGRVDGYVQGFVAQTWILSTPVLAASGLGATFGPSEASSWVQAAGSAFYSAEQAMARARVAESKKAQVAWLKKSVETIKESNQAELKAMLDTYAALGADLAAWKAYKDTPLLKLTAQSIGRAPGMIASVARGAKNAALSKIAKWQIEKKLPEFSPGAKVRVSDAVFAEYGDSLADPGRVLVTKDDIRPFTRQMAGLASVLYGRDVLSNVVYPEAYLEYEHGNLFVKAHAQSSELMSGAGIDDGAVSRFVDEIDTAETGIVFLKDTAAPDSQWVGFIRDFEDNKGWVALDGETTLSPAQYLASNLKNGQNWAAFKIPAWVGMRAPAPSSIDTQYWMDRLNGEKAFRREIDPSSGHLQTIKRLLTPPANSGLTLSRQKLNGGFYDLLIGGRVKKCLLIYPNDDIRFLQYNARTKQWDTEKEGVNGQVAKASYPDIKQFLEQEKNGLHGPQMVTMLVNEGRDTDKPSEDELKNRIIRIFQYRNSLAAARSGTTGTKVEDLQQYARRKMDWTAGETFVASDLADEGLLDTRTESLGVTRMMIYSDATIADGEKEYLALRRTTTGWEMYNPLEHVKRWQPVDASESLSTLVSRLMGNTASFKWAYEIQDIFAEDASDKRSAKESTAERFDRRFGSPAQRDRSASKASKVSFAGLSDRSEAEEADSGGGSDERSVYEDDDEAHLTDGSSSEIFNARPDTPLRPSSASSAGNGGGSESSFKSRAEDVQMQVGRQLLRLGRLQGDVLNASTLEKLASLESSVGNMDQKRENRVQRSTDNQARLGLSEQLANVQKAKEQGDLDPETADSLIAEFSTDYIDNEVVISLMNSQLKPLIEEVRENIFVRREALVREGIKGRPEAERTSLNAMLAKITGGGYSEKNAEQLKEFAMKHFPA